MKLLIWDFDGTLGYRVGMWSGTLIEIVRRTVPDQPVTREQVRAIPKGGWPWDTPDVPHTHLKTAEQWWDALDPTRVRRYEDDARAAARSQGDDVVWERCGWCEKIERSASSRVHGFKW